MEQEKGEEEKKIVNEKELAELTRLNIERQRIIDQSKRMKYKGIAMDVVEKAKLDALDYIIALGKKYNFNPARYGVNRLTGEIQKLPDHLINNKGKQQKK